MMKKLLTSKWNKLQPCEKKAATVVGIITAVCLVTTVVLDLHDAKNRGAN